MLMLCTDDIAGVIVVSWRVVFGWLLWCGCNCCCVVFHVVFAYVCDGVVVGCIIFVVDVDGGVDVYGDIAIVVVGVVVIVVGSVVVVVVYGWWVGDGGCVLLLL